MYIKKSMYFMHSCILIYLIFVLLILLFIFDDILFVLLAVLTFYLQYLYSTTKFQLDASSKNSTTARSLPYYRVLHIVGSKTIVRWTGSLRTVPTRRGKSKILTSTLTFSTGNACSATFFITFITFDS